MKKIDNPVRNVPNRNGVPKRIGAKLMLDDYFDNKHSALKLSNKWNNAIVVEAQEEVLTQPNVWVTRRVFAVYR